MIEVVSGDKGGMGGSIPRVWRSGNLRGIVGIRGEEMVSCGLERARIVQFRATFGRSADQVAEDHQKYVQGIYAELIEEALGGSYAIPIMLNMNELAEMSD